LNGDKCNIGQWVLVSQPGGSPPKVSCIQEIIQRIGSENERSARPDVILLQHGVISAFSEPYRMPCVSLDNNWTLVPLQVCSESFIPLKLNSVVGHYLRYQSPASMPGSRLRTVGL
jgi:hypothetical protein